MHHLQYTLYYNKSMGL